MIAKIGVVVAYIDNIHLLAKTEDDAASMSNVLGSALKTHPAGPFQPKIKQFKGGEPIDFLGHKLTRKNGVIRIEPSDDNHQNFKEQVASECAYLQKASLGPHKRQKKSSTVGSGTYRSWTAHFRLCDGIEEIRCEAEAEIEEALMNSTTPKTFKLHGDQMEIVEAALKNVKDKTGTRYDTVALELICQQYMGTGFTAPTDGKSALLVEYKKAGDIGTFLEKVVGWVQEITGKEVSISYDE